MTDYEPKPCAECETTYTPKRKNNIYCSGKCADKVYNRKRREKPKKHHASGAKTMPTAHTQQPKPTERRT